MALKSKSNFILRFHANVSRLLKIQIMQDKKKLKKASNKHCLEINETCLLGVASKATQKWIGVVKDKHWE